MNQPLPDWFPEVSEGEKVYMRQTVAKNSSERWVAAEVHCVFRDPVTPNIEVVIGTTVYNNVLHQNDPRLEDPEFMAQFKANEFAPADGVFVLNPTRLRLESQIRQAASLAEDALRQVAALRREASDAAPRRRRQEAA